MKNSRSTDSIRLLALLSLGEVGHHVDLSGQPELKTVILDAFSSSSEEVSTPVYTLNPDVTSPSSAALPALFYLNKMKKFHKKNLRRILLTK